MTDLFHTPRAQAPVECLGLTFADDAARRAHFLTLLAQKLQDPAFRAQEGFPQASDAAVLALSDPPYYTACPNPWLKDLIDHYGAPYDPAQVYRREPFAADVSEGKTDPLYRAHSYHTKVPHKAIVPLILHYTDPGDVVLDAFCGSGMTGVAAQFCGNAPSDERAKLEQAWKQEGRAAPQWGARRAVLADLAPAATFIAANYNIPFDVAAFAQAGAQLLAEVEEELGWMYQTRHTDGRAARIEYTVWSEVFSCPDCAGEVVFLNEALDPASKRVREDFPCPHCGASLNKNKMQRLYINQPDPVSGENLRVPKRVPVLIYYKIGKKRYEKKPDAEDLAVLEKIAALPLPSSIPTTRMMHAPLEQEAWGDKWRAGTASFSHTHHLFLPRAAQALGLLWAKAKAQPEARLRSFLLFMVEQGIWGLSIMNRYKPIQYGRPGGSQVNQFLNGVYYVPSLSTECSPWYNLEGKLQRLIKVFRRFQPTANHTFITTGTAARLALPENCIDYIFTDPPFGANLAYAELNFLVEAFYGVMTQAKLDAVVDGSKENRAAQKSLDDYRQIMMRCFKEYFRVLKPGRWMTVAFSNSRAAVWNTLQIALQQAGFVVADVSTLDKQQLSFKAVTTKTAVKQDLVISAYKPNGGLEERFRQRGACADSVWDFVATHLRHITVAKTKNGALEFIAERDPRIIFDRMVAWFVRHNAPVPLSSQDFQAGLRTRFPERDGMFFLEEQIGEYDKKRALAERAPQLELFVFDERSAIDWVAGYLKTRPSTYQDIHPEFTKQLGAGWRKNEIRPELAELLESNFLRYEGKGDVPAQIHAYLSSNYPKLRGLEKNDPKLIAAATDRWYVPDPNKAQDLEKKREKMLLKAFEAYKNFSGRKKITESRLEVLRAGFRHAWAEKDYATIVAVADKLPDSTLQEDEKLLTLYDMALTRVEEK